jgi:hypothetical protein
MTLLQSFDTLLEKVTITDRQTSLVSTSYKNIKDYLLASDNGLNGEKVFQNGSYDRDTIIKPLDDIDIFFVLKKSAYQDENGNFKFPNPQTILTNVKTFINGTKDYKDKAKQDRPCITIHLSDKKFDILPCFGDDENGYFIPDYDLQNWMPTNPIDHSNQLTIVPLIRLLKYWNKEMNAKIIPSFHIEEIAINCFRFDSVLNYEEGVYKWFNNADNYLTSSKFENNDIYNTALEKLKDVKSKVIEAHNLYIAKDENQALVAYKAIFGDKFPAVSVEDAKAMSDAMKSNSLKMASSGLLTSSGLINVQPTKFFGDKN